MAAVAKNAYVTLCNGMKMPSIGLGTSKLNPGEIRLALVTAVNVGYRHIDTAHFYGVEEEIGDTLKELFNEGTVKREDMFITTKLWNTFHQPSKVIDGLKKSLRALQLDYIDLYLMHSPMATKYIDDETLLPRAEDGSSLNEDIHYMDTWKAMECLVEDGLTKSIGVSNFNVSQLQTVLQNTTVSCVVNQIENHPLLNQKKLIDFCKEKNVTVTSYSPLGSPGRLWATDSVPELLESPLVKQLAHSKGCSPAQLLIAYNLSQNLTCIPKSTNPSRIQENFMSLDVKLTVDDIKKLDTLECNFRAVPLSSYVDHPHYPF